MNHGQEKVFRVSQILLNSADDGGSVGVSNLLCDHADGIGTLQAQGAREVIWFVVEFPRSLQNATLRMLWNRAGCCRIVQSSRNRACGQVQMLGKDLQSDSAFFC